MSLVKAIMFWWTQYSYRFPDNSLKPWRSAEGKFETFEECRSDYAKFKKMEVDVPDMRLVTVYHMETSDLKTACKDIKASPGKLFHWTIMKRKWVCDFFGPCKKEPSYVVEAVGEEGFQSLEPCFKDSLRYHYWNDDLLGFSFTQARIR